MKPESNFPPSSDEKKSSDFLNRLEEQISEIREDLEQSKERQKPLPDELYHVTTRENYYNIINNGLDPSSLIFEDKEVVSLSDDIEFAKKVAEQTQTDTHHNSLVVLEVDTDELNSSEVDNYLREEDPNESDSVKSAECHEVHYNDEIPPDAISFKKEVNIDR